LGLSAVVCVLCVLRAVVCAACCGIRCVLMRSKLLLCGVVCLRAVPRVLHCTAAQHICMPRSAALCCAVLCCAVLCVLFHRAQCSKERQT
jgi:hypothetical protein